MAGAAAFEPVKQHHQRRVGVGGIDKIVGGQIFAVAVGQQLAAVGGWRRLQGFGVQRLRMAALEPGRCLQRRQLLQQIVRIHGKTLR